MRCSVHAGTSWADVAIFAVFAALGVLTAAIVFAVTTQVEGEVRSVFKVAALIVSALAVLTGYLAVAAWRRWWPLREKEEATT